MILNLIKKAIKVELMNFFDSIKEQDGTPSRQAFSQAREKISYSAFKDFFEKSCELAARSDGCRLYKGYRLLAVDGTSFIVGLMEKLEKYFGSSTTIPGKAMCRISGVVDVVNDCIVNASVSPFSTGERVLAIEQIKQLKGVSNALFLFDRGYWSPELISEIIGNGQKFLMRLASTNESAAMKSENGSLRHYSFTLPSGNKEFLVTNVSEEEMTDEELASLYAKRWGVETKYLELKSRLQIDVFSGESENIVLQDIYSTLYLSNLNAFICAGADEIIAEKTADCNNKYEQRANRSVCISALRKRFIALCLLDSPIARGIALERLMKDISKSVSYVGKSKSRPRDERKIKSAHERRQRPVL